MKWEVTMQNGGIEIQRETNLELREVVIRMENTNDILLAFEIKERHNEDVEHIEARRKVVPSGQIKHFRRDYSHGCTYSRYNDALVTAFKDDVTCKSCLKSLL